MLIKRKNDFVMRKITHTPDFVCIDCDFRIRWLQEAYFESIKRLPKVLFGEESFSNCQINSNSIEIPADEWTKFSLQIMSIFRKNRSLRKQMLNRMNNILKETKDFIDTTYEEVFSNFELPEISIVNKLLDCIIDLDTYAVFNMFIPYEYYKKKLVDYQIDPLLCSTDNLMICMFEPHRIMVRKHKIKLSIRYAKGEIEESEILGYQKNIAVYEKFEDWIYGVDFLLTPKYLLKEIRNIASCYSVEELRKEYEILDKSRKEQISKLYYLLCVINEKNPCDDYLMDDLLFLSQVTTEEEKRHMIECKIFAVLGYLFSELNMSSTRMSIEQIRFIIKYLLRRKDNERRGK